MAESSKLLLLGGAAAVAWWFYLRPQVAAAPPSTGGGVTPGATPPAAPPAPGVTPAVPAVIAGPNSLDSIYLRMVAAAKAPSEGYNVDEWSWFLGEQLGPMGKATPDPGPLFTASDANFDRSRKLTAAQYWGVMAPALRSQLGMSGLGRFGGMGQYILTGGY